jgi:hypothetical protein
MADEGMEEVAFKQVDKGTWSFKAPRRWLVGPAPHYLVNDAQKAVIAKRLRWTKRIIILMLAIFFVILGFLAARMPGVSVYLVWYIAAPVLVVLVFVGRYLAIRPLVRGLPRSSDRISLTDQMRKGAVHMSVTRSIVFFALFAALAVIQPLRIYSVDASGFHVRPNVEASDVVPLAILSAAFGVVAICFVAQILGQLRSRRSGT